MGSTELRPVYSHSELLQTLKNIAGFSVATKRNYKTSKISTCLFIIRKDKMKYW
jgi:hypothetical protein